MFAFHEQPGAFDLLTPPWERVAVIERPRDIQVGARVVIKTFIGPLSRLWIAEHTEYVPNRLFVDVQRRGPFAVWRHRHGFEPTARGTTVYTDDVEYALPLGWLGHLVAGRFVRAKLERLFAYRHQVVAESMKKSV